MPVTKKPAARKVAAKPRKKASPKRTFARPFVDDFLEAYVTAALWSSTDDDEMPMERRFGIDDIDAETLATMGKDCQDFQQKHGHLFEGNESQAGHDFWLTRNGHGAGFWDRPEVYGQRQADALSDASQKYGEFDLYVGDDGRVHGTPLSRRNGYALRPSSARRPAAKKSRASRSNGALSPSELTALRAYARKHGRAWKAALRDDWMYATAPAELMRLRNRLGPGWLTTYRLPAASTRSNGAAKRRSATSRSKAARPRKRR